MVLISKPFEVKATVDGMSLRFPFRVCRGLQPPKALACTQKRNMWSPPDGFLQKWNIWEISWRKTWQRGNLNPPNRPMPKWNSTWCQLLCTSLPRSFDHWCSSPEYHSTGWPCKFCYGLKLHISDIRLEVSLFLVKLFPIQWGISVFWSLQFKEII